MEIRAADGRLLARCLVSRTSEKLTAVCGSMPGLSLGVVQLVHLGPRQRRSFLGDLLCTELIGRRLAREAPAAAARAGRCPVSHSGATLEAHRRVALRRRAKLN
jgi:hypothetical protein